MARITGVNTYIEFNGTAIHDDYREFEDSQEVGLADATAGDDTGKSYLVTHEDGTGKLTAIMQADGTAATYVWNLLDKGASGTLIYGPEGTASGKPKMTVPAIVKKRRRTFPYSDMVEMEFELQYNGATVDSTY